MSRLGEYAAEVAEEEQEALPENFWFVVMDGAIMDSYPDYMQASAAASALQNQNPDSVLSVEAY